MTDELVAVADQHFATNQFEFATNWFEGYDIPLATNLNTLTLRVSDLAGNVTTTNIHVTLDFSNDAQAPALTPLWPVNGLHLSGDSCYLRGRINDETASVWIERVETNGVTNVISGLVERNGMFWVENLPLAPGTNAFTLRAMDAAGNPSSTNLTLVRSSVTLTIDSTPIGEALYEPSGTVYGTVDSGYTVTVNGEPAEVDSWGNWTAYNVPILGLGTATFDAVATPSGGGPGTAASAQKEMPAIVRIVKHLALWNGWGTGFSTSCTKDYSASFEPGQEGQWRKTYRGNATSFETEPYGWYHSEYDWADDNEPGTWHYQDIYDTDTTGPIPGILAWKKWRPDASFDHTSGSKTYYVRHFYAKGVRHRFDEGPTQASVTASARTRLMLYTGGRASVAQQCLIELTMLAEEYFKPKSYPWSYARWDEVDPSRIQVLGRPVGADGKLWTVQAGNSAIVLNLQVPDSKHHYAEATPAHHKLIIEMTGKGDVTDKTNTVMVGQKIQLLCKLEPATGTPAITNIQWSIPGETVKRYEHYLWITNSYTIINGSVLEFVY